MELPNTVKTFTRCSTVFHRHRYTSIVLTIVVLTSTVYCTTIVSLCMLHMSSIYNTCYRMLMFVNCDRVHHNCSSWHFWHIVHDSSMLSIMVQYLWGYIYSLSMIWRYYMNVMFLLLLYNQDLRECCCKSRSTLYGHHHHIDCILYAVYYRLLLNDRKKKWLDDRDVTASNQMIYWFQW